MKKLIYPMLAATTLAIGAAPQLATAQSANDTSGPAAAAPELPRGTAARYRVTFFKSNTATTTLRTGSVVSITNNSNVRCLVAADWKYAFAGVACTTSTYIAPGATTNLCSRSLPSGVTTCTTTCPGAGLTFHQGNVIVGSSTTVGCDRIAVSARTYYTSSTNDAPVGAITDQKVVRYTTGNIGD